MHKVLNNGRSGVVALLFGLAVLAVGCGKKEASAEIKIEDIVVSKQGGSAHQAAVDKLLQEKIAEVRLLSKQFSGHFTGKFTIDTQAKENVLPNGTIVPILLHDGKKLNNDHTIPDLMARKNPDSAATIFVKSGNDFVRIATSLKRSETSSTLGDVDRAFGTKLGTTHPAANNVIAGAPYHGTAKLYGSVYMTEYTPIKNQRGEVIGILFVGMDIDNSILILKGRLGAQ